MSQDILNCTLLTSTELQVGPSEAQSLNGLHSHPVLLDPGTVDPLAWGELVVIVPVAQVWMVEGELLEDELLDEVLFGEGLQSANLLRRMSSAMTPLFACFSELRAYTRACRSWFSSCDLLAAKVPPAAAAPIAKARAMAVAILNQNVALRKPKILFSMGS